MYAYSNGNGHVDLARELDISTAQSLAIPGSCNSRIIRTTLKDSYITDQPTLYVVGLSFLHRNEMPVGLEQEFEGRWLSFQNAINPEKIDQYFWTDKDSCRLVDCFSRISPHVIKDRLEQLMFNLLTMISDLEKRNHRVIVFRQPPEAYADVSMLDDERFTFLKNCVSIIDGLNWSSLEFLATKSIQYTPSDSHLPTNIRHPLPGEHTYLNTFLVEYIKKHNLL